jgi:hypothetical protein
MIMPDLEPFKMPDGTVISGRVAYNRYCKEKGVTNVADYTNEWAEKAKKREALFTGSSGYDREERRRQIAANYKEFKTYGEYQRHLERIGKK